MSVEFILKSWKKKNLWQAINLIPPNDPTVRLFYAALS